MTAPPSEAQVLATALRLAATSAWDGPISRGEIRGLMLQAANKLEDLEQLTDEQP